MPWINLDTLLGLLKRARRDPRKFTVYIPDADLPIPVPPHPSLGFQDSDEGDDEFDDLDNGED